jgi:hypothetical protein
MSVTTHAPLFQQDAVAAPTAFRIARWFYLATFAVTALALLRAFVLNEVGPDTVLQDLRHFDLDAERNLGAWFSSGLMLLIGLAAVILARHSGCGQRISWRIIAVIFVLMSLDETAGFHEVMDAPLREHFALNGFLYNPWVFAGALFVAAFALYMIPFLLSLPRSIARIFVAAGAIYVGGALGLEPVDAWAESTYGAGSSSQFLTTTIEETMEMLGLSVFLHGLLLAMQKLGLRLSKAA